MSRTPRRRRRAGPPGQRTRQRSRANHGAAVASRLRRHFGPLELPRGEAARVDEEAIHARRPRVIELDFESVLVSRDGFATHGTLLPLALATPRAIRRSRGKASLL